LQKCFGERPRNPRLRIAELVALYPVVREQLIYDVASNGFICDFEDRLVHKSVILGAKDLDSRRRWVVEIG
jgi:hypothetical protein